MGGCVVRCGVLCCFFWLCLCTEDAVSSHNCSAEIRFPSLDVSLDDDNTPTTLHFEVVSKCNDDLGQYRLVIRTTDGSHTDLSYLEGTSLCSIRSVEPSNRCGGQCNQTARGLSCRATDTFHRRPHRTWKVEGNNNIIAKIAVFNVSYPTNFTYFDIPHLVKDRETKTYQVEKGNTYQFECRWEEGNPLRQIVLRGPGNKALKETSTSPDRSTMFRHSITPDCSTSGQYRCEVEGTRQFKTVTLLVKCPLEFNEGNKSPQLSVYTGRNAIFTFNVTSYTTAFTSCQLTTPSGTHLNCKGNIKREVTVRGSPPNFNVIVTVKDVTEEDNGTWTLTAANGATNGAANGADNGEDSDAVSFRLSVTRRQHRAGLPLHVTIAIVSSVVVVGFIVIIGVFVGCLRHRQKKGQSQGGASPKKKPPAARDNECEMIVNDLYGTNDNSGEVMIVNDFYEGSGDMRTTGTPVDGTNYESMDEVGVIRGGNPPPRPPRPKDPPEGPVYVDQTEIQRNKARNKKKEKKQAAQEDPPEGPVYVDQAEIQRNKARNKEKTKKQQSAQEDEGAVYVDQAEIQRNKAQNKEKARRAREQADAGNAGEDLYVGQEEIQRNKARNKKKNPRGNGGHAEHPDGVYSN